MQSVGCYHVYLMFNVIIISTSTSTWQAKFSLCTVCCPGSFQQANMLFPENMKNNGNNPNSSHPVRDWGYHLSTTCLKSGTSTNLNSHLPCNENAVLNGLNLSFCNSRLKLPATIGANSHYEGLSRATAFLRASSHGPRILYSFPLYLLQWRTFPWLNCCLFLK